MDIDRQRFKTIQRKLVRWWRSRPELALQFPWRSNTTKPYEALLVEVLLQRTRAEAVSKNYISFFTAFPTPDVLCSSSVDKIRNVIASLGLHWRADLIRKLGCRLRDEVPTSFELLVKLPNVGPYAAGAFLSLHCGIRAIIPDANMVRILGRIVGIETHAETRRSAVFLNLCDELTPIKNFHDFNYGIIDLGRLICTPRSPKCPQCVLKKECAFYNSGRRSLYEKPPKVCIYTDSTSDSSTSSTGLKFKSQIS